jgi:hypothetical protein
VLSGVLVGFSLLCKQSVGIYLGGAAGVLILFPGLLVGTRRRWASDRWTEVAAFGAGVALPVLPMLGYFAAQGLLGELLYSGLVRPFTSYLPTSGISFIEPLRWWDFGALQGVAGFAYFVEPYWSMLMTNQMPGESWYPAYWIAGELIVRLLYSTVPLAFLAVLVFWVRAVQKGRLSEYGKLFSFAILSLAVLLSAFPRADFIHIVGVYPLVVVLLYTLWSRLDGFASPELLRTIETAATVLLVGTAGMLATIQFSHLTYRMSLERAELHIDPRNAWVGSIVKYARENLGPDDRLFVYGHDAYYYFLCDRYYPWPFSQLYPGQEGSDGGRALAELLRRDPPKLVIRGMLRFPGVPYLPDYAPILEAQVAKDFVFDRQALRGDPHRSRPQFVTILRPRTSDGTREEPPRPLPSLRNPHYSRRQ